MTDTTDIRFDDILGSAAPAMPEGVAARLRASVLAEVRIEARPIRQRWFARVAAVAVAATTILSGASYAVAAAKPGEPLYPARQAMVQMGSAVAGTVTRVLHIAPAPGSRGSGSAAPGGVGHPGTGISTGTPMPGSGPKGPGMTGPGSSRRGGGKLPAGSTSGPSMGGASGGTSGGAPGGSGGSGSKMGPTAPGGMSGTSGGSGAGNGSGAGSMGGSQPKPGDMVPAGGTMRR